MPARSSHKLAPIAAFIFPLLPCLVLARCLSQLKGNALFLHANLYTLNSPERTLCRGATNAGATKYVSNELDSIFMFHVAHKLREGRPLLDASAVPFKQQQAALTHFEGIFEFSFENELRDKWNNAIDQYGKSEITALQCVNAIKDDFVSKLMEMYIPDPKLTAEGATDRQAYLIYMADLMASYLLLFSPQYVRLRLYEHIWATCAFLNGTKNWVCCSWMLNGGIHDEKQHSNPVELDSVPIFELINIIRLHKAFLSPDFISRRSRSSLAKLDRVSLLSIFQSIMVKVLWCTEPVGNGEITSEPASASASPNEEAYFPGRPKQILNPAYKEEEPQGDISSFHGWMRAFRKKRDATHVIVPKTSKLEISATDKASNSKTAVKILMEQMTKIEKIFKGYKGDTPVNDIIGKQEHMNMRLADDVTVNKVKMAMKKLLEFYQCNLAYDTSLYGYIANVESLKFLKFLLNSYEKHELLPVLFSALQALPELKPIESNQDYVDYSMLSSNTIAKLAFIGSLRLSPNIIHQDLGVTLQEPEIQHFAQVFETRKKETPSGRNINAMAFVPDELKTVKRNCELHMADAKIGGTFQKCVILDSHRSRMVNESILCHISNYNAVCSILGVLKLENTGKHNKATFEALRLTKLISVLKTMSDDVIEDATSELLESASKSVDFEMPQEDMEISYSCKLDELSKPEMNEKTIYSQLERLLEEESSEVISFGETEPQHDERESLLNFLKGEDLQGLVDGDSNSAKNLDDMTTAELDELAHRVVANIQERGNCEYLLLDEKPGGHYIIRAQDRPSESNDSKFRLNAKPRDDYDIQHGFKNIQVPTGFEQRGDLNLLPSWQDPKSMLNFFQIRNRVDAVDTKRFIYSWLPLGLDINVAQAGVAHIRKSLLDSLNLPDYDALEIIPTEIQKRAIPKVLSSKEDLLISSNAASGKTLSYLLPIVQLLKRDEKKMLRYPNSPRALVLAPSRELADQILNVLKQLGHVVKLTSASLTGGRLKSMQTATLDKLVDVVVATPQRFLKMKQHINLQRVKYVILEEADTLLNEGFWEDTSDILDMLAETARLIMVSPSEGFIDYFDKFQREYLKYQQHNRRKSQSISKVNRKNWKRVLNVKFILDDAWIHRPNPGVEHRFIHLKSEDKIRTLVHLIQFEHARRCKKIIVFCNTLQSCRAVEHHLVEAGLPATSLHGKVPILKRRMYYKDFINGGSGILVCTELASRGLDFKADAVIMFDFPLNSSDYLRRCGRVGRMINNDAIAPKGYAFSLVKRRDRPLAIAIERSLGMPFFPLNALTSRKRDYNQLTGRLRYLTQAGGYFKLANLLRQEEIKGTFDPNDMHTYLERFKQFSYQMRLNSLKKVMLRRRKICKRRRILTRRLKLMKRWNRTIRLKQRLIAECDRRKRLNKGRIFTSLKPHNRKCPRLKDLKPIRGKLMQLKLLADKLSEAKVKRNDRSLLKFINKVQRKALYAREKVPEPIKFNIIDQVKKDVGKGVKRICSLV